jgi:ATP-dependent Clp protease adaptor protein ClpS
MTADPALSNSKGLVNLGRIIAPDPDLPRTGLGPHLPACGEARTVPYFRGRVGRERWSENVRELRLGVHPFVVGFPAGISNACAMRQLTTRFDRSVFTATASASRMSDDDNRSGGAAGPATSVIAKVKPKTKRPNLYRVLILNDDYTPMEFVVHVLEKFFQKDVEAATKIMLHVHHHGIGECGVFTYEIAETKVTQVMDFARKHQHPLQCVMEKK